MSRTKWVGCVLIACAATGVAVANAAPERGRGAVVTKQVKQVKQAAAPRALSAARTARGTQKGAYIVVFDEPALASYRGGIKGLAAPSTRIGARGGKRLDSKGEASLRYVAYLQRRQAAQLAAIESRFGRAVGVRTSMQHALNAVVADFTIAEARALAKLPGVRLVEAYREYALDTDHGPELIGAPAVWDGSAGAAEYQGEGVVVGVLDTGVNYGSPSFAAVDPVDSYAHVNPLGAGSYIGTCLAGGDNEGDCNDKLIGGWDFVCNAPANQCGQPNIREEPGFGDTNSHGSHVGSTIAGNHRNVTFRGVATQISGVAPRANVVAYDICYTNTATSQGLCPNVSGAAAANQVVADGIVDVINYSIGGGTAPWSDAVSLAFLSAVDAGVYIAASAGNSGPNANTLGHHQPWVSTTAAAQHGRGDFVFLLEVTGPTPVPVALQAIVVNPGAGGVDFTAALSAGLAISPGIDTANDGCAAFAAGAFTGKVAVIRRGTCAFSDKVVNAAAAGALGVVIANNQAGAILPSVPGTTIPAFGVTTVDGDALRDWGNANATATLTVGFPAVAVPNTPDQLASFSSRGPAGTLNVLKPDITGPGVSILAVTAGTTVTGFEQSIGLLSGTSMSSPHNAGAAALVKQARPTWTPSEIKSALMLTSKTAVLDHTGVAATPHGKGAGRLQVDRAINSGLVLDETVANYTAANPGAGGNPTTLNLASLSQRNCYPSCTFTRTFRNPLSGAPVWSARLNGVTGTVSPRTIKVVPGGTVTVTITIDGSALPATGAFSYGELVLDPGNTRLPKGVGPLSLPVAIARQP